MTITNKSLRSAIIWWSIFIVLSLWPVQAANNPLELSVSSDRAVYKEGDVIHLKLEFYNNSPKPLVIYTSLFPEFNLNMDIARVNAGYETKLSWPRRLYERTAPQQSEFVTLTSHGAFKDNFTLQEYMDDHVDLLVKGEYRLTVRYSNDYDGYQQYQPYSFINLDAWKGKIVTNTIIIKIE